MWWGSCRGWGAGSIASTLQLCAPRAPLDQIRLAAWATRPSRLSLFFLHLIAIFYFIFYIWIWAIVFGCDDVRLCSLFMALEIELLILYCCNFLCKHDRKWVNFRKMVAFSDYIDLLHTENNNALASLWM